MRTRYLIIALGLVTAGCGTTPPRVVVEPVPEHGKRVGALEVRFSQVDIERIPFLAAVDATNAEVRKTHGDGVALDYGYTAGPYPGAPEGPVTVHATNISFRQLLDEFCRQTGWRYHVIAGSWIEFRSGPVPGYKPEIRRPKT
jgi:hypothetical protein